MSTLESSPPDPVCRPVERLGRVGRVMLTHAETG
jgi:hypothetical protein